MEFWQCCTLVTEILVTATLGFLIKIPDDVQIKDELVYFIEILLIQEPIDKLTLERNTYASFTVCVYVCYLYYINFKKSWIGFLKILTIIYITCFVQHAN